MRKGNTKKIRTLKTRIDAEEAAYAVVLTALSAILQNGDNQSESAAVRRLLYLGALTYLRSHSDGSDQGRELDVLSDSTRGVDRSNEVESAYQKSSERTRPSASFAGSKTDPSASATPAAATPHSGPSIETTPRDFATDSPAAPSPTAAKATRQADGKNSHVNALSKLRAMAVSGRVDTGDKNFEEKQ